MLQKSKFGITIEPADDRYAYARQSSCSLSQEHFTDKEIGKIQTIFFTAATRAQAGITTTVTEVAVPGDVEESYKNKAEKAEKAKLEADKEKLAAQRQAKAYEIRIAALELYDSNDDNLTLYCCMEQKLGELVSSTWERDNVKKTMVELGFIPKD